jgi:hypothetical protein
VGFTGEAAIVTVPEKYDAPATPIPPATTTPPVLEETDCVVEFTVTTPSHVNPERVPIDVICD